MLHVFVLANRLVKAVAPAAALYAQRSGGDKP